MWEYYSKQDNLDFTIYYCAKKEDRLWNVENASGVKEKFLNSISLFNLHFNPGIFKIIIKDYDLFVIGGYGYPTVMIAILMLSLLRKPWVLMLDGISPLNLNKEKWFVKVIKKFFMTKADAYFANGTVGKTDLENYEITPDKIFNQYMTVDVDYFLKKQDNSEKFKKEIRFRYSINEDSIVVIYVGRLVYEKGVQDLISAVKILSNKKIDLKHLIVGEGKFKNKLKDYAQDIKDIVIFTGHTEPSKIYKYYYASDIFVLPTYNDSWGLVVNEAMACGLPVIVTNAAGCSLDLVKNNGFVIKYGDTENLSESIKKLMNDKTRRKFGQNSRLSIQKWTYKESYDSLSQLIRAVID